MVTKHNGPNNDHVSLRCRIEVLEDLLASSIAKLGGSALGNQSVREWIQNLRRLAALRETSTDPQREYRDALEAFVSKVEERLSE